MSATATEPRDGFWQRKRRQTPPPPLDATLLRHPLRWIKNKSLIAVDALVLALGTIGLLVALVQAITQINEATLAFVPKVLALGAALVLLGPFMVATLTSYTHLLLDRLVAVGGS